MNNTKPPATYTLSTNKTRTVARCSCGISKVSVDRRNARKIVDAWMKSHHTHFNHRNI